MATTKDIIKQALRRIGVTAAGEEPDAHELNDAYLVFQQMRDSWSLKKLMVPAVIHESFDVDTVGAANNYSIGTSGDLNTDWPLQIVDCRAQDAGGTETPIMSTGLSQWSSTKLKSSVEIPQYFYYEKSYPLGQIYFDTIWPDGYTIKLVSWKELAALPALDSELTYPPGYDRALRLNLEIELCPEFERPVNPVTVALAKTAMRDIKRMNATPLNSRVDSGLQIRRRYGYDINSGPGV